MLHTQSNAANTRKIMELVISNPHVEDLRTFYSMILFLIKLKQDQNHVLSTKIELSDLLNMDDETVMLITKSTDLSEKQVRNLLKLFNMDVKNLLNASKIANF